MIKLLLIHTFYFYCVWAVLFYISIQWCKSIWYTLYIESDWHEGNVSVVVLDESCPACSWYCSRYCIQTGLHAVPQPAALCSVVPGRNTATVLLLKLFLLFLFEVVVIQLLLLLLLWRHQVRCLLLLALKIIPQIYQWLLFWKYWSRLIAFFEKHYKVSWNENLLLLFPT